MIVEVWIRQLHWREFARRLTFHIPEIEWRAGEQWSWNTLVDADEANNPVSWQWVAGCGADASRHWPPMTR